MVDLSFIKEGLDEALDTKTSTRKALEEGIGPGYQVGRDGQLFPTVAVTPAQAFYNYAMMPGWQKWKPIYRHGVLLSIDRENNTGEVELEAVTSSAQGLDIVREINLSAVEFDYMNCDHEAFYKDDVVLVKFMPTGSMLNQVSDLNSAKEDLKQANRELMSLRGSKAAIELENSILIDQLGTLMHEWEILSDEYEELAAEDPQDPEALANKEQELIDKQAEIDIVTAKINDQAGKKEAKQADIDAKLEEIEQKKETIKSQYDAIAGNMADFAEPTIIGFKEEPKLCKTYAGLLASTKPFSSMNDDKIHEWRQGDPTDDPTIWTEIPDDPKEYNNAWSLNSKIKIGASWKYPWSWKIDCDICMSLVAYFVIYGEEGDLLAAIPIKVNYDSYFKAKDKVLSGGNGTTTYFVNSLLTFPLGGGWSTLQAYPAWNALCDDVPSGMFYEGYDHPGAYTGLQRTDYWAVVNLNGFGLYRRYPEYDLNFHWSIIEWKHWYWAQAHTNELGPSGYYNMGICSGTGVYDCSQEGYHTNPERCEDGLCCPNPNASDRNGKDLALDEFLNLENHPCFQHHVAHDGWDPEILYKEQSWSMEGTITEKGVILTDVTGNVTIDFENITLPIGGFDDLNATQGDSRFSTIPGLDGMRHHVGFAVIAFKTDDNTSAAIVEKEYPNRYFLFNNDIYTIEHSDDGEMEMYALICPADPPEEE